MERRNNMRIIAACLLASIIATILIPLLTHIVFFTFTLFCYCVVFTLFVMSTIAFIDWLDKVSQ